MKTIRIKPVLINRNKVSSPPKRITTGSVHKKSGGCGCRRNK